MGVNYIIYILNIIYIIIYIILRVKFAGGKEMKIAFVKVLKCYSVKEALHQKPSRNITGIEITVLN